MQWEDIGRCGNAQLPYERDRIAAEAGIGIDYIKLICGHPPKGCALAVMWHKRNLGEYATIGLSWDPEIIHGAPWEYISRTKRALNRFDWAVNWSPLKENVDEENEDGWTEG